MLSCEIFLHELLIEYFASYTTRGNEASKDELEHNQNDSEAHISV